MVLSLIFLHGLHQEAVALLAVEIAVSIGIVLVPDLVDAFAQNVVIIWKCLFLHQADGIREITSGLLTCVILIIIPVGFAARVGVRATP